MPGQMKETALYAPVRHFLETNGYAVRSEVLHCDVVAVQGEQIVIVELKRHFSSDLLIQAVQRQHKTPIVYVAVPRSPNITKPSKWKGVAQLLQKLDLGLLLVHMDKKPPLVEIALDPPLDNKATSKGMYRLKTEWNGRTFDNNQGGSTGQQLVTAYREQAIFIACLLETFGPLTPKKLRGYGTNAKTQSVLSNNFYGWFRRIKRGWYDVDPAADRAWSKYERLSDYYYDKIERYASSNK